MDKITYAYLETTNYCNLDCSFCNRKEVIGPLKHISLDNWDKVLDSLKHHPITEAKLMGMGEPFLHPQFDIILKRFKEVFPNCKVIVATNCQYKLNEKIQRSLEYIDMLYLSIDGYKESYERDRAPAKWSKLISFLEELQDVERYHCEVVVNYVVNKYNVYDIPKIEELIEKYNLGELRLNIAQDWDGEKSILEDDRTWGYTQEQLDYLKENYKNNIKGKAPWTWSDCFWVNNGIYMTVEGNIKMCCMNTGAESIGNIFEDSIDNIRLYDSFQEIRKGCHLDEPTDHCKHCSYKELSPLLERLIK
jgi:radical SAM protein with 4Fe4S-binding SPASM domain